MNTKILDWGKRYDIGELFSAPALEGHEIAVVSSGMRGARVNYFPPTEQPEQMNIQCDTGPLGGAAGD